MDRSFLSQPEVIAASRSFVCVRLATYEDEAEGRFLQSLVRTRSGELENSVFAIMSPDGKQKLVRAGRSMRSVYSDAAAMADGMKQLSRRYQSTQSLASLPLTADVRLGIVVAAADSQPLVILTASDPKRQKELRDTMSKLAWSHDFVGRFVYVESNGSNLKQIHGLKADSAFVVVKPNKFGTEAMVLAQASDAEQLPATLAGALKFFAPESKTFRTHVRDGHMAGVFWKTKLPVTDPMEAAARARGQQKR